jgi:preprotein translocase subunit Sss1
MLLRYNRRSDQVAKLPDYPSSYIMKEAKHMIRLSTRTRLAKCANTLPTWKEFICVVKIDGIYRNIWSKIRRKHNQSNALIKTVTSNCSPQLGRTKDGKNPESFKFQCNSPLQSRWLREQHIIEPLNFLWSKKCPHPPRVICWILWVTNSPCSVFSISLS